MRKAKTFSLEEELIDVIKQRAERQHTSESKIVEAILRKGLRIK